MNIKSYRLVFTCILTGFWYFAGCTSDYPNLQQLPKDATILAFGDSLTYGTGVDEQHSYPAILQTLSEREVINAGIPGEETDAGLMRFIETLDQVNPDLVVLCHGGNDILRNRDLEHTTQNLNDMILASKQRKIPVVLIAVPKKGIFLTESNMYAELAAQHELALENQVLSDILSTPGLKSDPIHPNREGYRILAQAVFNVIRDTGAL